MFNLQKNECLVQIHADSLDPIATEQVKLIAHHPALAVSSVLPANFGRRSFRISLALISVVVWHQFRLPGSNRSTFRDWMSTSASGYRWE